MMTPQTEGELADMISAAIGPLLVQGGGTRLACPPLGDVLSTAALCGVQLYEPASLTLVARAGTPLAEIDSLLAGERQRLAFDPPDMRAVLGRAGASTLGGVVATNASGPRRLQVGACRDSLLGVRFVDGRGRVVQNGGRVMKNVTGYDLVKLMAGSYGSLGVLTEASFKVQAIPEADTTLVIEGLDDAAGLAALRRAMGTPYDISGAARVGGQSLIRIEGMEGSVAYRAGQLRARAAGDVRAVEGAQSAALWDDIRDVRALAEHKGDIWRLSVLPTDGADIAAQLCADRQADVVYDWGGGLMWAALPVGRADDVARAVRGRGAAIKLRGAAAAPFAAQDAGVATLTAGLKAQFDPRHILNQGLM